MGSCIQIFIRIKNVRDLTSNRNSIHLHRIFSRLVPEGGELQVIRSSNHEYVLRYF